MNKKGIYWQIMALFVILIALGTIMMLFWGWSVIAPSATSIITDITSDLKQAGTNSGDNNLSNALNVPLDAVKNTADNFAWVTYLIFIVSLLGFLVLCFYVRSYPFLIVFWIFGIIVMVVISLFITNAYQDTIAGEDYVSVASRAWTTNHYLMSNLPIIITGIGIIGGIILFALISREPEAEAMAI